MDLLRIAEFAYLLGVSPSTVRRWLTRGLLPCIRLPGGERRVHQYQLEAILRCQPNSAGKNPSDDGDPL